MIAHMGAIGSTLACDPELDEAINKRREASDKQIDTVDQEISNAGQRMLDCMVDFADVVGNSIVIGGQQIDLSGLVKQLNQEACRMTREASQGRMPTFPSTGSVGRAAGGVQVQSRTQAYTPQQRPVQSNQGYASVPLASPTPQQSGTPSTMSGIYDTLSSGMSGGKR
jgi:hypothetical protein